jgi:hypothetical protein
MMWALSAAAMLCIVSGSSLALADSWQAKAALEPDSPAICRQADVSTLVFNFADTGSDLSGKTTDGHNFLAPIGTDGSVSTTITLPVGGRNFVVALTGNAKSRALQVFNKEYSCRFKLTPVQ